MLTHLRIQDLATIRDLALEPGPGFNVLTGETGAGKSILVGALSLLFGARASRELIRGGSERAVVTGAFEIAGDPEAGDLLRRLGLEDSEGTLVIRREIRDAGRGRVLVNGEPATVGMLATLAEVLGCVHGQGEDRAVLGASALLATLDARAGLRERALRVRTLHARLVASCARFEARQADERLRAQRLDLLEHQVREIEEARLPPTPGSGEDDEDVVAERARARLARAEDLSLALAAAAEEIYEADGSALDRVARARRALADLGELVPDLGARLASLAEVQAALEDVGRWMADEARATEADPRALESLEERLVVLAGLKRKYGPTLADVREHAVRAAGELAELQDWEATSERLGRELAAAAAAHAGEALELSRLRRAAAPTFQRAVEADLRSLEMPAARFELRWVRATDPSSPVRVADVPVAHAPTGIERACAWFSANAGEEPRPLARVASGGERSRLALVLQALAQEPRRARPGRTWVFDEVDAGLGGEAAACVGRRLADLAAAGQQVFCVTHLPQVAAAATTHHRVAKEVRGRRTTTTLRVVEGDQRLAELTRLLAGRDTPAGRRHAAELLNRLGGERPAREAPGGVGSASNAAEAVVGTRS